MSVIPLGLVFEDGPLEDFSSSSRRGHTSKEIDAAFYVMAIGCAECQEPSGLFGPYRTKQEAQEAIPRRFRLGVDTVSGYLGEMLGQGDTFVIVQAKGSGFLPQEPWGDSDKDKELEPVVSTGFPPGYHGMWTPNNG